MFLSLAHLLVLSVLAQTAPTGSFSYMGVSCNDKADLQPSMISDNEDIRFRNEERILEFQKDVLISQVRKYAFDRYGQDHCRVTTHRKIKVGAKIEMEFIKRDKVPNGKYGSLACKRVQTSDEKQTYSFQVKDNLLYLGYVDPKHDLASCKKGPAYSVYNKVASNDFPENKRPEMSLKEKNLLEAIQKSPNIEDPYALHILFLLGEERIDEVEPFLSKMKVINPKSKFALKAEKIMVDYKAEKDEKKRDKEFRREKTALAADLLKDAFKPLARAGENLSKDLTKLSKDLSINEISKADRQMMDKTKEGAELLKTLDEMNRQMKELKDLASPEGQKKYADQRAEESNARRASLEKKYSITEKALKQYSPTTKESRDVQDCKNAKDPKAADDLFKKAGLNFPNSPHVLEAHVRYLIDKDRIAEADSLVSKDSSRFPNQIDLLIVQDYMPRFRSAKDAGERAKILAEMREDILAATKTLLDYHLKKAKPKK